ncbi:MAG: zf-HC2 domain-containing protein [Fimbriimonadales bacterium]|nr:zf-HC2 domain-containing protein [Fimbriimonadales bacterium]
MRCEQVRNLLNEYVDGALSGALRDQLQAHLASCAECRREWRWVQAIWRGLSDLPPVAPPPDLHARIMTHVRAHTRAREAQQRIAFWRWAGAAAVAASLFLMGFFVAQSDGVQAAFGFGGSRKPAPETPQPVQAGVFIEYRTTEDGMRLPVLTARMNREATAELHYIAHATPALTPVWRGTLQPGKTVEIPLQALLQASKERVLTLHWSVDGQRRVLFVPAGYPPAKIATVRLQAKLGEALRQLVSVYQTPIEWVPNGEEPLVVLDVQDTTLEDVLRQLLVGSKYTFKRHGEAWQVISQQSAPRTN